MVIFADMERIQLSKSEKTVLRFVASKISEYAGYDCLSLFVGFKGRTYSDERAAYSIQTILNKLKLSDGEYVGVVWNARQRRDGYMTAYSVALFEELKHTPVDVEKVESKLCQMDRLRKIKTQTALKERLACR